jgi:UDP-N-acetylglucosamine diphosphorylase/glucosamine-1-phosphate N-acetyltransferase
MIQYLAKTALAVADEVLVVIGHQADAVRKALSDYPSIRFVLQKEQLGTGHAVMTALPLISEGVEDAVILCGDTPFIKAKTLHSLIREHRIRRANLTLATTILKDPFGYGRVICDTQGRVMRIVEETDASEEEKEITTVNTGTYCIRIDFLKRFVPALNKENAQGEFYLTEVVEKAYGSGIPAVVLEVRDHMEVLGINTLEELKEAEKRLR